MKIKRVLLVVALCGACVFGSVGCGALALPSALAKLAAGNVGDLTPEEILALSQVAADFINSQNPGAAVELTPEQAAAIANFLDQNNVTTLEELEALFMEAETNPDAIVGLDELAAAFEGTADDFDPDSVTDEDLQELFDFLEQGGA